MACRYFDVWLRYVCYRSKKIKGGQFQYFYGTKDEIAEIKNNNKEIPPNKIISPEIPGPGFAVFQQGMHVVHRALG